MKVEAFIFSFHKFQSFALAKLYHKCIVLSMFYFPLTFAADSRIIDVTQNQFYKIYI